MPSCVSLCNCQNKKYKMLPWVFILTNTDLHHQMFTRNTRSTCGNFTSRPICGSVREILSIMYTCNKTGQDSFSRGKKQTNIKWKGFYWPKRYTILTDSHLLEDISQFLHVVVIVFLTILPGCKALVLILHICFPDVYKVRRLHHPQFAAGTHQSPEPFYYLRLLPLKETGAEYAKTDLFALLEDAGQLAGTRDTGTGWYVPCDVILLGSTREHLERKEGGFMEASRRKAATILHKALSQEKMLVATNVIQDLPWGSHMCNVIRQYEKWVTCWKKASSAWAVACSSSI